MFNSVHRAPQAINIASGISTFAAREGVKM
jgi:hypothetical protein